MTTEQLHITVLMEGFSLILLLCIILSSFCRWRVLFVASSIAATMVFFSMWHFFMALGSVLTYGPASLLLWLELDKRQKLAVGTYSKRMRVICWVFIAIGVALLISKNIYNIYQYLS